MTGQDIFTSPSQQPTAMAPLPSSAPSPQPQPSPSSQNTEQLQQLMHLMMTPHKEVTSREPSPESKEPGFGKSLAAGLIGMLVPAVGSAITREIRKKKDAQVNEAMVEMQSLHDAYEMAWLSSKDDQNKADELFQQMPAYQALFGNSSTAQKRLKNWAKVFSIDLMNPEKAQNTVQYHGLQKFLKVNPASQMVKKMAGILHGGQKPQQSPSVSGVPGLSQGQPPPQGGMQSIPMKMQQPAAKDVESLIKILQGSQEFGIKMTEVISQHQRQYQESMRRAEDYEQRSADMRLSAQERNENAKRAREERAGAGEDKFFNDVIKIWMSKR